MVSKKKDKNGITCKPTKPRFANQEELLNGDYSYSIFVWVLR